MKSLTEMSYDEFQTLIDQYIERSSQQTGEMPASTFFELLFEKRVKGSCFMAYKPKVGDIIKMHAWHGVVLNVFTGETGSTVLQVQTARNVFRGYPPEFIEVEVAPEAISPATRQELEAEINYLQRMREVGLKQMLESIKVEDLDRTKE